MKSYYDALFNGDCCDCDREQTLCIEDGECLKRKENNVEEEKNAKESV